MFKKYISRIIPLFLFLVFFCAFSTLAIVRHNNYQSFGYDLGINDQTVWRYAHFQLPLTTIDPFPNKIKLVEHVEIVYALIAPFYWIWDTRQMFLLLQVGFVCSGALAMYMLARKRKLSRFISNVLIVSFLMFFGVQNALWTDVHSVAFGAAFIAWFLYFLDRQQIKLSLLFFFLAITAKENIALITLLISFVYFLKRRNKILLFFMGMSILYLLFIFKIYFPYIVKVDYLYQNRAGLLSNLSPLSLIDTQEKRDTILYSFASFGFLPLLTPMALVVVLGHFATYFMLASDLSGAQGIYGQYRIMLAPIMTWVTILTISRFKSFNKWYVAIFLLASALFMQYMLHLPLSYVTKSWFWTQPAAVATINTMRDTYLPKTASVVAQNNIVPHISHRDQIYSLYPEKKDFLKDSPCGQKTCDWFRWYGHPEFLFVDTSVDWDARHLLTDRPLFVAGLANLEKAKVIVRYKQLKTTMLYKINMNPDDYK